MTSLTDYMNISPTHAEWQAAFAGSSSGGLPGQSARFTHFGYLVWHLPEGSTALARLQGITAQCSQHGVGLIRILDPQDDEAFETILDPVRKPAAVDGFLEQRLTEEELRTLRAAAKRGKLRSSDAQLSAARPTLACDASPQTRANRTRHSKRARVSTK